MGRVKAFYADEEPQGFLPNKSEWLAAFQMQYGVQPTEPAPEPPPPVRDEDFGTFSDL